MKKTSLNLLLIAGCVLAVVVLALALIAFWMEKKTGYPPVATPPADAPANIPAHEVPAVGSAPAQGHEVPGAAQSPEQEEEQEKTVEYDGIVRGPMTM